MSTYSYDRRALENDSAWEFKIVRARNREFGQPGHLAILQDQERAAGWMMTDIYNDSTVRFIRPRHLQARDRFLPPGIDPYRTTYMPGSDADTELWFILTMGAAVGIVIIIMTLMVVLCTFHM